MFLDGLQVTLYDLPRDGSSVLLCDAYQRALSRILQEVETGHPGRNHPLRPDRVQLVLAAYQKAAPHYLP